MRPGKNNVLLCFAVISFFSFSISPYCSEIEKEKNFLTYDMAVRLALMHNSDIAVARIDKKIIAEDVSIEESVYDTNFFAESNCSVDEDEPLTTLASNKSNTFNFNFGFIKKFFTGTLASLKLYNKRNSSGLNIAAHNPYYDTKAELSLSQPVLNGGFGIFERSRIKVVKLNVMEGNLDIVDKIEKSVAAAEKLYWKVAYNYENLRIKEEALHSAESFYDTTKEQFENGALEKTDVYAAEANIHLKRSALLAVENDLYAAIEDFKLAVNYIDMKDFIPCDKLEFDPVRLNEDDEVRKGLNSNRQIAALKIEAEKNKIDLKIKKNSLLPKLDLTLTYASNGLSSGHIDSVGEAFTGKDPYYYAGISFSTPVEKSYQNGKYAQALLEKEKIIIKIKQAEDAVEVSVRKKVREILNIADRINETFAIIDFQGKKLSEEKKKYSQGRSSSDIILRYENDLLSAKQMYNGLLLAYKIALIELKEIENLVMDETDWITYEETGL